MTFLQDQSTGDIKNGHQLDSIKFLFTLNMKIIQESKKKKETEHFPLVALSTTTHSNGM